MTVSNNGSTPATPADATALANLVNNITAGSTRPVAVTFSKGASDNVRFNMITALYAALKSRTSGAISMKSTAAAGQEIAPLFNGDDLYGDPTKAVADTSNSGKVFSAYNNNDIIFEGYTVKYTLSGSRRTDAYIEVGSGKTISIDKLRAWQDTSDPITIKGFGINARNAGTINFVGTPTIAMDIPGAPSDIGMLTPADFNSALLDLKLDYTAGEMQEFNLGNIALVNNYSPSSTTPVNIADSMNALRFLEKHADAGKLGSNLHFRSNVFLNITGQNNPYSGNGLNTSTNPATATLKVSGTLVGLLLNKKVNIQEVYATNPNLSITGSINPVQGIIRNSVFEGANWGQADFSNVNLKGVITSTDAPFAMTNASGNQNLWYVIQGRANSTNVRRIRASIIEIQGAGTQNLQYLQSGNSVNVTYLSALITQNKSQSDQLQDISIYRFSVSANRDYFPGNSANTGGVNRPAISLQNYAATVANGNNPNIDVNAGY